MKINVFKIKKYDMKTSLWKYELLDYDYDAAMLLKISI